MKRLALGILILLILAGGVVALAQGGSADDPFISKSYADNTFVADTVKEGSERTTLALNEVYITSHAALESEIEDILPDKEEGESQEPLFLQRRVKRGDVLTLNTGAQAVLLAGEASLTVEKGALIDVTLGSELPSGGALALQHQYMAAEESRCLLTVTSDTAVVAPLGAFTLAKSEETDYNALADALKEMGMFKGSGVSYGDGYELERVTTRIEGLILFLRLLGEEEAALAYTGECPFVDVQAWSQCYTGYAFEKGYTKGVGGGEEGLCFNPYGSITSLEYQIFVLRALGYQDGEEGDFSWETALETAREIGCITPGEYTLLNEKPFLRAQVAYVSYFALDAQTKAGGTLLDHLASLGSLNRDLVRRVRGAVTVKRIA